MRSIADYKQTAVLRRGFKKDPLRAIRDAVGGDQNTLLERVILQALPGILQQVVSGLLKDDSFKEDLIAAIASKIPTPRNGLPGAKGADGYTPKKGKDYFTQAEVNAIISSTREALGKDFLSSKDIEALRAKLTPRVGIDFEQPKDGKNGTEIEAKDIVSKVNGLPIKPEFQIDASHIKNLPAGDKQESVPLHRGGLKLVWNTKLSGTVNGSNAVFTVPAGQPDPKDDKFIISVRGVLKTADAGDFTVTNGNRTITFASAPPNGSDSPRIILYHGK